MQIFYYSSDTGEFLGTGQADPDPMREGGFLFPAFSTPDAPPAPQDGQAFVRTVEGWEAVPDHRGETWWPAGAEFNTAPVRVDFLGDPAAHDPSLTAVEPPAPPIPPIVVSARQIRIALNHLGLRATVEGWVQAADQDTQDTWQFGSGFSRAGSPPVDAAEAHGKTPEEIDALFELAKTL